MSSGASLRLTVVVLLRAANGGEADPCDILIWVHQRFYKAPENARSTFDIASILGMVHLVEYVEGVWLVNNWIDLGTWNKVYMGAAGETWEEGIGNTWEGLSDNIVIIHGFWFLLHQAIEILIRLSYK
jgi:hypothetical protein